MLVEYGNVSLPKADQRFYVPHEVETCRIRGLDIILLYQWKGQDVG